MIPRIKHISPLDNFQLDVLFDDGKHVVYDVLDDINTLPAFVDLKSVYGLFNQVQLDESRTCVYWNDRIDLASDSIYEYGTQIASSYIDEISSDNPETKVAED